MRRWVKQRDAIDESMIEGSLDTPLMDKCGDGDALAVSLLLDARASIEKGGDYGRKPLHSASKYGQVSMINLLIGLNADVEARDEDRDTPLHMAAQKNQGTSVEALVAAGADVG